MLKRERQVYILHQVNLHNKVLSADLSQHMNVSDDTFRRDLPELAEAGKLIKVHDGVMSPSFHRGHHSSKDVYSYQQKKIIAQKAASLIKAPEAVARIRQLVCESAKIDTLVTELSPDDPLLKPYKNAGIQVL